MKTYLYLFVMALTTYLIRVLPLLLIRREIRNRTLRSYFYYLPFVTLSVMTFPAVLSATGALYSALAAFLLSAVLALACFAPSPAALLSAGALTACALLAPLLRKIRAGNLRHAAV